MAIVSYISVDKAQNPHISQKKEERGENQLKDFEDNPVT